MANKVRSQEGAIIPSISVKGPIHPKLHCAV